MRQRGRKSSASLGVVAPIPSAPPREPSLPREALAVWRAVVGSKPADYFDAGAGPLLEGFAVATAEHRRLSALVATLDPLTDLDTLAKLTRLLDSHAARIGALATKLRLSNQARYTPTRAASAAPDAATYADRVRSNYLGAVQ